MRRWSNLCNIPGICIASRDRHSFYFGDLSSASSSSSSCLYAFKERPPYTFLFLALGHYSYTAYRPASRTMVDMQRHSFEETSTGSHKHPLTSHSRSESSKDSGPVQLTEFATINLPFFETPTSQSSLPKPKTRPVLTPVSHSKENRVSSPNRGRSRVRNPGNAAVPRSSFRSPMSPDRFIPKRDFVEPTSTTFRVAKHPQRLSPQERLLRRRPPGDDPFLPSFPRRTYTTNRPRQPTRLQQIPHQRPRLVTEGNITGNNAAHESLRQVSSGAVWNVGGASAVLGGSLIAAPDDTPTTSTNGSSTAPNFVARFLPKKPKYSEQEIHESRLALALGIDPTIRQLGTTCLRYLDAPLNPASPDFERLSPFEWKDSAWKRVEKERCKCNCGLQQPLPDPTFGINLPFTDKTYMIFLSNFWKL